MSKKSAPHLQQPLSSPVRYTEGVKLAYWGACVKEAERYSPSGGVGQPRIIPSGGVTLPGGQYLPRGYQVTVNPNAVHFDKDCFGEDVGHFRPERWIENDEERIGTMERHLIGFGKGPRVCRGKHVRLFADFYLNVILTKKSSARYGGDPQALPRASGRISISGWRAAVWCRTIGSGEGRMSR